MNQYHCLGWFLFQALVADFVDVERRRSQLMAFTIWFESNTAEGKKCFYIIIKEFIFNILIYLKFYLEHLKIIKELR